MAIYVLLEMKLYLGVGGAATVGGRPIDLKPSCQSVWQINCGDGRIVVVVVPVIVHGAAGDCGGDGDTGTDDCIGSDDGSYIAGDYVKVRVSGDDNNKSGDSANDGDDNRKVELMVYFFVVAESDDNSGDGNKGSGDRIGISDGDSVSIKHEVSSDDDGGGRRSTDGDGGDRRTVCIL